jgi:hypothetical protein
MSKAEMSQEERGFLAHFGGCPECGGMDGIINIGPSHWLRCNQHKVTWSVGSNLFGRWRDQTEAEQRKIYDDIGMAEYREISCEEAHTHLLVRQSMLEQLMRNESDHFAEVARAIARLLDPPHGRKSVGSDNVVPFLNGSV